MWEREAASQPLQLADIPSLDSPRNAEMTGDRRRAQERAAALEARRAAQQRGATPREARGGCSYAANYSSGQTPRQTPRDAARANGTTPRPPPAIVSHSGALALSQTLTGHEAPVLCLQAARAGFIYSASSDGTIRAW